MFPLYETIEEYQRLIKNAINQNVFLLPNMKYESIKYEGIIWKYKIAHFRLHFSDKSEQRYYIGFLNKTFIIK